MRLLVGLITIVLCVCIYAAYYKQGEAFSQIVPRRLFYITVADRGSPGLTGLQNKADANGEILNVIGVTEQRDAYTAQLQAIHDLVNSPVCNSNDIILYTDAHDVVYCGDKATVLQRYVELNSPIVIGATKVDPGTYTVPPSDASTPFPYIDGGLLIGRAWALRECLKDWAFHGAGDDSLWITQYLTHPDIITIDHEATLFLNTAGVDKDDIQYEDGKVAYRCSTMPQFVLDRSNASKSFT